MISSDILKCVDTKTTTEGPTQNDYHKLSSYNYPAILTRLILKALTRTSTCMLCIDPYPLAFGYTRREYLLSCKKQGWVNTVTAWTMYTSRLVYQGQAISLYSTTSKVLINDSFLCMFSKNVIAKQKSKGLCIYNMEIENAY